MSGRTLAFVSGAPRTSTKSIASLTGGRQHMLGTIGGFIENGWRVDTYVVGDRVPESWLAPQHEMSKGKSTLERFAADLLRIYLSSVHTRRALRELEAPDWVYERHAAFQMFGLFFKRRGIPWILETNGPLFDFATSDLRHVALPRLVRWSEALAYRRCDILVVVSEDLKRIIVGELGISARKIVVVPNAADPVTFDPARVAPHRLFDERAFVIGWQGGMYDWAGLDYLLRAVAILRSRSMDVAVVLVGDGHERSRLEALAVELAIDDYVRFVGRVARDDVPALIAGFDVGFSGQVNLSTKSMYLSPLKLYDYMAMGKPIVASRFPDAVTLAKNGELGFLFEPEDLDDLVTVAGRAYARRSEVAAMGTACRDLILSDHTWARRVRDFIRIADDMLGAREPGVADRR